MIRHPPRSTLSSSSAASDVYKRQVLKQMGYPLSPVLYLDYGHPDILVSPDPDCGISKNDVVKSAQFGPPMTPKSTAHVVRAGDGSLHPIVSLSPNCALTNGEGSESLTGGWSYKPVMTGHAKKDDDDELFK
eukprot:TRINITY_DN1572_c0_g1_i1.p1 TRINITY_DN1572_c0_g1~~TRINITY_DN1572_c0_g1_i1.p1  ORF type:complete len:132 (-),score=18.62 TRINITY_DN1572_c0_g1_i1:301-696(-)